MLSLKHTQTSYGTTNRFPECQKQTNGRKRLLSSTQGPWILFLVANLRRLIIRLHLQFQSWIVMFEQKLSKVTSLWKDDTGIQPWFGEQYVDGTHSIWSSAWLRSAPIAFERRVGSTSYSTLVGEWQTYLIERLQCLDTHTCSVMLFLRFN